MPLLKRRLPFDDPDWLFELKLDGFRSLAVIEHGRAQLLGSDCDQDLSRLPPAQERWLMNAALASFTTSFFRMGSIPVHANTFTLNDDDNELAKTALAT